MSSRSHLELTHTANIAIRVENPTFQSVTKHVHPGALRGDTAADTETFPASRVKTAGLYQHVRRRLPVVSRQSPPLQCLPQRSLRWPTTSLRLGRMKIVSNAPATLLARQAKYIPRMLLYSRLCGRADYRLLEGPHAGRLRRACPASARRHAHLRLHVHHQPWLDASPGKRSVVDG